MKILMYEDQFRRFIREKGDEPRKTLIRYEEELQRAPVIFQNKPYPLCPKVTVTSRAFRDEVKQKTEAFVRLLEKVIRIYEENRDVRSFFMLDEQQEKLSLISPGYKHKIQISRFDTYLSLHTGEFQILENNTDCPAGVLFTERVYKVTRKIPFINEFLENIDICEENILKETQFLQHLLRVYDEFHSDHKDDPTILILQERDKVSKEVVEIKKVGHSLGMAILIGDPRETTYDGRHLHLNGHKINLVWNKINTMHFIPLLKESQMNDYLKACSDRVVCQVNSFQARFITESKLCLAFLSDPEYRDFFDQREAELINRHVPWTRKMEDKIVEYEKEKIHLVRLLLERKDDFVIKTAYDIRGDGVYIGRNFPQGEWEEIVRNCVNKPFVAQKFVSSPKIDLPDETFEKWVPTNFSLDMYMFGGEFQGFGSKVSSDLKMNIFKGGSKHVVLSLKTKGDCGISGLSGKSFS